jgi:3-methyl-2-oxobutanoate hydroxymethyltransferase
MEKITVNKIKGMGCEGRGIVVLTAYDHPFAQILDEAGVDIVLVGDSLGNVALGYKNTLPVTMEEMIVCTRAVARGVDRALLVADLPFGSYQENDEKAVANAIKLVKAGAEAVKLEGTGYLSAIKKIIKAGIPVMGHLGFTPQSVNLLGYKTQGKSEKEKVKILNEAKALEQAGCFAMVLELMPEELAAKITKAVRIPTIGIGAGARTSGQVLVTSDLLGLYENPPSFVKPKLDLRNTILTAIKEHIKEAQ